MVIRHMAYVLIGTLLAIVSLFGCKKKQEGHKKNFGGVTSIGAIETGSIRARNATRCGIDNGVGDQSATIVALKRVHAILPKRIRKEFMDLEKRVVLFDAKSAKCPITDPKNQGLSDSLGLKDACWQGILAERDENEMSQPLEEASGESPHVPIIVKRPATIHILNDPEAIENYLLLMSVYAYTQFYIDMIYRPTVNILKGQGVKHPKVVQLIDFIESFVAARANLANAVIEDLVKMKAETALASHRERFRVSNNEDLKSSASAQNYFLAEIIDSYYCSPTSYDHFMTGSFTSAKVAFQPLVDLLESRPYFMN